MTSELTEAMAMKSQRSHEKHGIAMTWDYCRNQASLSARMSRSGLAAWLSDTGFQDEEHQNLQRGIFAVSGLYRQSPSSRLCSNSEESGRSCWGCIIKNRRSGTGWVIDAGLATKSPRCNIPPMYFEHTYGVRPVYVNVFLEGFL